MSTTGTPVRAVPTIASLVADRARRDPKAVAVRWKHRGIWHEISWARYHDDAQEAAHMLRHLGLGPGGRMAVVSENRYQWLLADVASAALRAVTVGVDPAAEATLVADVLSATSPTVVIAENQEQVDKVLAAGGRVPGLRHIVYLDDRGVRDRYEDPRLRHWDDAMADAGSIPTGGAPAARTGESPADAVVTLIGGVGTPPDVTVSAGEVAAVLDRLLSGGITPPPSQRDRVLPFTSLADAHERLFSTWLGAAAGLEVHFAEAITTVRHDLWQVQPTIVFAPPAVWERLAADIDRRLRGATRVKRWVWRAARAVALRSATAAAGDRPARVAGVAHAIGHVVVYRALRDRIGMRHVRYAVCAGAVAPEVLRLFRGLGVPLEQIDRDLFGVAS